VAGAYGSPAPEAGAPGDASTGGPPGGHRGGLSGSAGAPATRLDGRRP